MKKVIIDYSKLRDAELLSFSKVVLQHINDNPNFPNPVPSVANMADSIANYETALTESGNHDRQAVSRKNTFKATLVDQLRQWAMYVNTLSQGDLDMLNSSNLKLPKQKEPVKINAPVIKWVMQGANPGTLVIAVNSQRGVKTYLYQIAADPITEDTQWESFGDSRTKFEFANLEQGKKYWIRVIAIGSNGQAVQSSEVAQYVMQRTMAKAA
jgi:hypothetical protein